MSDTVYTKKESDGFLRLQSEESGFYGFLILDDDDSRLLLTEGDGGKHQPVAFNKIPK